MAKNRLRKLTILAIMYGGFLIFLLSTNPNKLAVGWLIVPFIWLFAAIFLSVLFIMGVNPAYASEYKTRKRWAMALLIAAVPTLVLILDSIDQLTLKDGLLIAIFAFFAVFYTSKLKINSR